MPIPLPPLNLALNEADNSRTAFGAVGTGPKEINFGTSKAKENGLMLIGVVLAIGLVVWALKKVKP